MLKGGLELYTLWTNDKEAIENEENLNIPIPEEAFVPKPITFYIIENVKNTDDINTCVVSSGGEDFLILESSESVNKKIRERQNFLMN